MAKIMLNGVDYSAPVASGVAGVKGNAESAYRTGSVNLTPENIGAAKIVSSGYPLAGSPLYIDKIDNTISPIYKTGIWTQSHVFSGTKHINESDYLAIDLGYYNGSIYNAGITVCYRFDDGSTPPLHEMGYFIVYCDTQFSHDWATARHFCAYGDDTFYIQCELKRSDEEGNTYDHVFITLSAGGITGLPPVYITDVYADVD